MQDTTSQVSAGLFALGYFDSTVAGGFDYPSKVVHDFHDRDFFHGTQGKM